ncbi:MAG: ABC transporter family substrate-binding protein [Salinibacterium sp.]|nr:ABC transporter family substrate-binding protein [Salinibacterium sp.]
MRVASIGAVAVIVTATLVLSGCTSYASEVVEGTSVSVGWDHSFYSYNDATSYGTDPANSNIVYATNSGFNYVNDVPELVKDESFGSYTKLSDDPLIVRYTIADGVTWSDGAAVGAADLLLNWAALSGALNDPIDKTKYIDPSTGKFTDAFPADAVYFDSGANQAHPNGLALVSQLPIVSDDLKSITMRFDSPLADWELVFRSAGLPAHVIGKHALGITDEQRAKDAVIAAITTNDRAALAKISAFWNTGFNLDAMPSDPDLLVGDGPYVISDFVAGEYVTLTANPEYVGSRMPNIETIVVRVIPDPLAAVQALFNGSVQVIVPQASTEVTAAFKATGQQVVSTSGGTYEHLDLQFAESKNGYVEDARIREAFLKTVPRAQIVTDLVTPVQKDATTRDSHVFLPGTDNYTASVAVNGSADYADVDIEGAKALLAEAGVPNPVVCVLYDPTSPRRVAEFGLIQTSAALAGISVTDCSSAGWRDLLGAAGAYDAALYGWQPSSLSVTAVIEAFSTNGRNNLSHYSNKDVDALLAELSTTFDPVRQVDIETRVDALLWADGFGVPLFQYPSLYAFDKKAVSGISSSVLNPTIFWNVWDWKAVTP